MTTAPTTPTARALPGPKILLVGSTGSGKTHSVRTLLDAGLEVFCVFTEPGMEVLSDTDPERLHWHYIPPAAASWEAMLDSATKINTMTFESLTKQADINKRQYTEFLDLIRCISNFIDDRTGKTFGPVDSWGTDRALVIDSLSGLNIMAMNLVAGSKPVKSMADWGVALLERLSGRRALVIASEHRPMAGRPLHARSGFKTPQAAADAFRAQWAELVAQGQPFLCWCSAQREDVANSPQRLAALHRERRPGARVLVIDSTTPEAAAKLAADPAFAADGDARLAWFYERTPFYDQRYRLYPVGREN